jgi:hypothetical protein
MNPFPTLFKVGSLEQQTNASFATRRTDYARSFLLSQAIDLIPPRQGMRDALYPSIHKRVFKPVIYPDRERERRLGSGPVFALVNGSCPDEVCTGG